MEDFFDALTGEPRETFDEFEDRLVKQGKLDG
jgi:hypothetical protein